MSKAVTEWVKRTDADKVDSGGCHFFLNGEYSYFRKLLVLACPWMIFTASAISALLILSSMIISACVARASRTSARLVVSTSILIPAGGRNMGSDRIDRIGNSSGHLNSGCLWSWPYRIIPSGGWSLPPSLTAILSNTQARSCFPGVQ